MEFEDELWDDNGRETKPIYHLGCGGRVYWISGDEHRCLKCSQQVDAEDMQMEVEA